MTTTTITKTDDGSDTVDDCDNNKGGDDDVKLMTTILAQADLYAGALFIEQSIGWDIYPAILLLLAIAAIFTITGR